MKEERIPSERTQAVVTAELHHAMRHLIGVDGVPASEILAIMHAEIVNQITFVFGGKVAAECCEAAARRVVELPPVSEFDAVAAGVVLQ